MGGPVKKIYGYKLDIWVTQLKSWMAKVKDMGNPVKKVDDF
jgi:hypothetical protein